jgi:hypothetical protein
MSALLSVIEEIAVAVGLVGWLLIFGAIWLGWVLLS